MADSGSTTTSPGFRLIRRGYSGIVKFSLSGSLSSKLVEALVSEGAKLVVAAPVETCL